MKRHELCMMVWGNSGTHACSQIDLLFAQGHIYTKEGGGVRVGHWAKDNLKLVFVQTIVPNILTAEVFWK